MKHCAGLASARLASRAQQSNKNLRGLHMHFVQSWVHRARSRGAGAALGSLALFSPLYAQQQPASNDTGVLAEVIVTAQFREENLQDTPIAITAVSGEKLEDQGLTSVKDLGLI